VSFNDKLVNVKRLLSLSLTKLGLNDAPVSVPRTHDWVPKFTMLSSVTSSQVLHVFKNLSSRTSQFDFIPTSLLKVHGLFFTSPIAHLVNFSFGQSVFPTHLKTG